MEKINLEDLIIRRSDHLDVDKITQLIEPSKRNSYNNVYGSFDIIYFIENCFLSITVLTQENQAIQAYAAFDDFHHSLRVSYDKRHMCDWENWIPKAFKISTQNPMNTLFNCFFIISDQIEQNIQLVIYQKILQCVYNSLPHLEGLFFFLKGDSEKADEDFCFKPISSLYTKIEVQDVEILKNVKGLNIDCQLFYTPRIQVLPFVEIRVAKQEDHDDLASVFNNQSEVETDIYGEFFIADMIAAQNDNNKALVAQVNEKAVGLMSISNNFDIHSLQKNFFLEEFDYLLKADFMNLLRKRRQDITSEKYKEAEEEKKQEMKQHKEETMKCKRITQRIELQEFCKTKETEITSMLEGYLSNEEEAKKLDKKKVSQILEKMLTGFIIRQPSDFFLTHPTKDYELVGNIQTPLEFLISTLNMFGLPLKYMDVEGHFADWGKKAEDELKNKAHKRTQNKKKQEKMLGSMPKNKKLQEIMLQAQKAKEKQRPTHFDLAPFLKAFKLFMVANGEMRSKFRMELKNKQKLLRTIFVDEEGDQTFKKCLDVMTVRKKLESIGFQLSSEQLDMVGPMLICFGEISFINREVLKMPEELKAAEESKEQEVAKFHRKEVKKDSDAKEEPPKPIPVLIYETSIHDFLQAAEKMTDYDYTLHSLGLLKTNLDEELKQDIVEQEVKEESKEVKEEIKKIEKSNKEEQDIFGGEDLVENEY